MIFLLVFISVLALCLSVFVALGEAWHERDWPRDTAKYPFIFAGTTLLLFGII